MPLSSASRLRAALAAAVLCAAALPAHAKVLEVVASFTVLADVVREIGGEHVRVVSLVGPNGDPHEFQPSPEDARRLRAADLIVISGNGLESWFERLARAAGYRGQPIVASAGIETLAVREKGRTVVDPHVWNSTRSVVGWVGTIEAALSAADPEDAAAFRANAIRYRAALDELDAFAHARLDPIPLKDRKILTSHDAFGYFARDYGLTILSPIGISTEAEASAADIAKLIDQIRREGVKVYFFESSNNPRLVAQIAKATGAKPGGALYVESLSGPDGPAPTYLRMFRQNVERIAEAFGP